MKVSPLDLRVVLDVCVRIGHAALAVGHHSDGLRRRRWRGLPLPPPAHEHHNDANDDDNGEADEDRDEDGDDGDLGGGVDVGADADVAFVANSQVQLDSGDVGPLASLSHSFQICFVSLHPGWRLADQGVVVRGVAEVGAALPDAAAGVGGGADGVDGV